MSILMALDTYCQVVMTVFYIFPRWDTGKDLFNRLSSKKKKKWKEILLILASDGQF